ncbi:MAG: hypothetical protein IH626_12225 [Rhodospirillales bacterium]|nr:hypothetical protein [Rhodospirillales bacterium]
MADIQPEDASNHRDSVVARVRSRLGERYGECLVTEHGRVPVCCGSGRPHDAHCFHAHFLVFPGVPDIVPAARHYFKQEQLFGSMAEAMTHASTCYEYFYVSTSQHHHLILSSPLNAPRQLARVLVAQATGRTDLSDWRSTPQFDRVTLIAGDLKSLLDIETKQS